MTRLFDYLMTICYDYLIWLFDYLIWLFHLTESLEIKTTFQLLIIWNMKVQIIWIIYLFLLFWSSCDCSSLTCLWRVHLRASFLTCSPGSSSHSGTTPFYWRPWRKTVDAWTCKSRTSSPRKSCRSTRWWLWDTASCWSENPLGGRPVLTASWQLLSTTSVKRYRGLYQNLFVKHLTFF